MVVGTCPHTGGSKGEAAGGKGYQPVVESRLTAQQAAAINGSTRVTGTLLLTVL